MPHTINNPYQRMEQHNEQGSWILIWLSSFTMFAFNEYNKLLTIWFDWDFLGSLLRAIIIAIATLLVTFFGKKFLSKYFPDKNK